MNRKIFFIGTFILFLIGIVSATPYILFVDPTPGNNYETTGSSVMINSTIENISTLNEFIFQWQGTNYSLYDEDLILMLNLNNNSNLGENDTLVYDSSRGQHNGSVLGNAEFISSGKYQGSYKFNGSNSINISGDLNLENSFTISMWINLERKNFTQFSVGGYFTCGLTNNGSALCLGRNNYGQLGNGDFENSVIPKEILGGHNFSLISAGHSFACGLLQNDSALCWGRNNYGQLGNGSNGEGNVPTYVLGGYEFKDIFPGKENSCGLLQNGSALCWEKIIMGNWALETQQQCILQPMFLEGIILV